MIAVGCEEHLEKCGSTVASPASLRIPKSRDLAETAQDPKTTGVALVECRQSTSSETVVVELSVDLPVRGPRFDIRPTERLAVTFGATDRDLPDARALRDDFPVLPHQNRKADAPPLSLCYTEVPYADLKRRWTSSFLLDSLSNWLRLSAKGKLHQADQPLEPFLDSSREVLIVSEQILQEEEQLVVLPVPSPRERHLEALVAVKQADVEGNKILGRTIDDLAFRVAVVDCPVRTHGIIHRSPKSLADLDSLLSDEAFDFTATLRSRLRSWKAGLETEKLAKLRSLKLLLVLSLPKARQPDEAAETTEHRAFVTSASVEEIGVDIGAWVVHDGHLVDWAGSDDAANENQGEKTLLDGIRVMWTLTRSNAAALSGRRPAAIKSVAVGVGALGSQVVSNLLCQGFGAWTFIDHDILLPHNTVRHELAACYVGMSKAQALAQSLAPLLSDEEPPRFIHDDILQPERCQEEIEASMESADLVIDMSASLAVGRHFAFDARTSGRRISVFLNPTGTDLVVLAEPQDRSLDLFDLEVQYYRLIATNAGLSGHFPNGKSGLRYSHGCRDVSAVLPLDAVATHAAIASRAVQDLRTDAIVSLWHLNPHSEIQRINAPLAAMQLMECGEWRLRIDARVSTAMVEERAKKLQRETGGVLIGAIDTEARVLAVVGAIPSPPDSREENTLYIRGSRGLSARVRAWNESTGGNLVYLGEWHSHPDDASTDPSGDDLRLFDHLTSYMRPAGLPALMVILGADRRATVLIGKSSPVRQDTVLQ